MSTHLHEFLPTYGDSRDLIAGGHGSTESLKYLVAFRPGLISPTLAAQMSAAFQWQSRGRLLLNVVTGGEVSAW